MPPLFYTKHVRSFELCATITGMYIVLAILYNLLRKKTNRRPETFLILSGVFAYIALSYLTTRVYRISGYNLALGLSDASIVILFIANMIALIIFFSRTETELSCSLFREREMAETNQLLNKLNHVKSDFMANISHEMRTPLTVMSSYAGLTSLEIRKGAVNKKTLDNLNVIKREATRLADMVDQIKKISMGKELQHTHSNIKAVSLLHDAIEFCKTITSKNGNKIVISSEHEDITVNVNEESIFQVLINLITNANRHVKKGVIVLDVHKKPDTDFVEFSVTDSGNGINPKLLPHIFQPGLSGDGGSGLGLTICKDIIEDHGGEICIESEQGKGTAVHFTVPVGKTEHEDVYSNEE
jgi:signal transduction histidine kinase